MGYTLVSIVHLKSRSMYWMEETIPENYND